MLVRPQSIPEIDALWMQKYFLSEEALIRRAGDAVASAILSLGKEGEVLVLSGGGNNGADGYATALSLLRAGVRATVVDVFGKGQRSEGGNALLNEYRAVVGEPLTGATLQADTDADVIVEAVAGSGVAGALSPQAVEICRWLSRQKGFKVAVDLPLGVDGDHGELGEDFYQADMTVALSLPKRGMLSYPARGACGEIVCADLGIRPSDFEKYRAGEAIDAAFVKEHLPTRLRDSHKGSFGRLQVFGGSRKYRGAAHLAALGALRMGVGLLTLTTEEAVVTTVARRLPELLFDEMTPISLWTHDVIEKKCAESDASSAILVGPGAGVSRPLFDLLVCLSQREGSPLLLDADALGAIAAYAPDVDAFFRASRRPIALTPHPLEFGRLIGKTAQEVQNRRMSLTVEYAQKWGVSLLLKGAATLVADKDTLYINTTGSSALAKGGSGDVLAGAVGALLAQGTKPTEALAIGAYLHGAAGDALARDLSEYGVIPSELPRAMAKALAKIVKAK